jgi:hypothetical protein
MQGPGSAPPSVGTGAGRRGRGFTNEEAVKDVSIVAVAGREKIEKDLTFLKIKGLLKSFFVLLKHGHLAEDAMSFTL